VRSSAKGSYAFDRLFMAHLGSRLGAEYDRPLAAPLPSRFWDMLLKLALLEALSERQVEHNEAPQKLRSKAAHQDA
jgi:hypothetical protein